MTNASDDVEEILRRPGAKEMYLATKGQAWIDPFLSCKNRVFNRLGATLLVSDLLVRLDPVRAERDADEEREWADRDQRAVARARTQAAGRRVTKDLTFYCDEMRHLVCTPYTKKNLHRMARALDINPGYFHRRASYPHYDIPKRRYAEIARRCTVVRPRELLVICQGGTPPDTSIPVLEWAD